MPPAGSGTQLVERFRGEAEFLDEELFVVGDGLFGDVEGAGDLLIGPRAHEEEFGAFETFPVAAFDQVVDESAEERLQSVGFMAMLFGAAGDAGGDAGLEVDVFGDCAGFFGLSGENRAALFAEVIDEFVGGDGEEEGFEGGAGVVIGEAVPEAEEGFLNEVFGLGMVIDAAVDEGEEPAFEAGDEFLPGVGIPVAGAIDEPAVEVGER